MSSAFAFARALPAFAQLLLSLSFFSFPFPACVFCTQTRGIGLALPQKTDSEGLPQITIGGVALLRNEASIEGAFAERRRLRMHAFWQVFWLGGSFAVASQWRLRAGFAPGFPCSGRLLLACDSTTHEALARDNRRKWTEARWRQCL